MKKYQRLGVTEEVTGCDCCGRSGLIMTVALENTETGQILYFGRYCAARAEGWGKKPSDGNKLHREIGQKAVEALTLLQQYTLSTESCKRGSKECNEFWSDPEKNKPGWRAANKPLISENMARWNGYIKQSKKEALARYCRENNTTPERVEMLIRSINKNFTIKDWL